MDKYKVDRHIYVIFLIIIVLLVSLVEIRQRKVLRDVAEIKQTVERIELNTTVLDTIVIPLPDSMPWYHIEFKLIHKEVNNGNKDNN